MEDLKLELIQTRAKVTELRHDFDDLKELIIKDNDRNYNLLVETLKKKDKLTNRIIIGSFTILGTITLAAFGITKLTNIF